MKLKEAEFDQFADEYYANLKNSIAMSGESPEFFAAYKVQDVARVAKRAGMVPARILDFGSGVGASIPHFREHFPGASLVCSDVSSKSLEVAKKRFPGHETYSKIEGDHILLEDDSVDIAFSACVFHHIPPDEHRHWLHELYRVVKPGGFIFVFEHNPFNPLTVRVVSTCPYDENAILIRGSQLKNLLQQVGWASVEKRYRLFFPGQLAVLRPLERLLAGVPLGAQYYVFGEKR